MLLLITCYRKKVTQENRLIKQRVSEQVPLNSNDEVAMSKSVKVRPVLLASFYYYFLYYCCYYYHNFLRDDLIVVLIIITDYIFLYFYFFNKGLFQIAFDNSFL